MAMTAVKSRIAGAVTRTGLLRASAPLTSSYVPGTVIDVEDFGMLVLLVKYTMGAGETSNALVLKVELSGDGVNFYHQTSNAAMLELREYTFGAQSAPGTYDSVAVVIPVAAVSRVRVSAKESGVESNAGTGEIKYALGW